MTTTDTILLTSIKALLQRVVDAEDVSPGPWKHIPGDSYDAYPSVQNANGHFIIYDHSEMDKETALADFKYPGIEADASFIALSRTLLPVTAKVVLDTITDWEADIIFGGDTGLAANSRLVHFIHSFPKELLP